MKTKRINTSYLSGILVLLMLVFGSEVYSQWNYGTPLSTSAPSPSWPQVQNRVPLNEMFDSLSFPYPTNAWFNNLYLGQQTYPAPFGIMGANKIHPYPYQMGLGSAYGSYPNFKALLSINYRPFEVITGGDTIPFVSWNSGDFVFMGTADPTNVKPSLLNDYTDLSVNLKFVNTSNTSKWYEAPIVRGMPYVTMFYNDMKPGVFFPSPAISKVNDMVVSGGQQFTNTVFKIETGGVPNTASRPQTWILYSSSPITLTFSLDPATQGLIATSDYTGYLRLAHVTYQGENVTQQQIDDKIALLTAYSKFIPVKGEVAANVPNGSSTATMQYNFTRHNEGSLGSDSLLMMALPHHVDMLSNPTTDVMKYAVLKGDMKEVKQKTWNMTENLPQYTFSPMNGKLETVPLQWCDTLEVYLNKDFQWFFNRNSLAPDVYFRAKTIARLGRALVIAEELYDRDNARYASVETLANRMRDTLKVYLGHYLDGGHTLNPVHGPGAWDSLFYDTRYGGLISTLGWDSLNVNCCFSFGSAVYNDHHFHYGYIFTAAASIAKSEPGWFTANSNHYFDRVVDLIRDVANPSRNDGHYAMMRYKDWFEGHSWANGLVPFGDGKNQESSSEAVNAWYGMYVFGHAMNNDNIKNTGALLLAQEIRATKKYYHIRLPQTNPLYPSYYTDKYHIAANLFQAKLDAHTFFSDANYAIHGIQVIPVIPATEQLWNFDYAKDIFDYPNGLRNTQCFNPGNTNVPIWNWTTINVGVQAIAYPNEALNFYPNYANAQQNYDNGASASNVIYWIITRVYNPVGISTLGNEIPGRYSLEQNYPNPFNPTTFITFNIPQKAFVKLRVFDMLGREVATLVQSELTAGAYKYEMDGNKLSSGVYFYSIEAGNFIDTKKMVLIK